MNDLISRQAAVDALEEKLDYLQMLNKDENPKAESKWYGVNWARNTIADLPSAEPKPSELARDIATIIANEMDMRVVLKNAQPERKKGKWVDDVAYYDEEGCPCIVTRCNRCGEVSPISRFCPNCGADMREREGE